MVYEFKASRFSKNNKLFPTKLLVDNYAKTVMLFKKRLIGYDQVQLKAGKIVSVTIHRFNELFVLSEIVISTAGGDIRANGFNPNDAAEIKKIIETIM